MSVISYGEQETVGIITIEQARLLDDANLRSLQQEITELVGSIEVKKVVLDFRLVEFVGSAGLGMLIRIKKRCTERGISLRLCSIEQTVAEAIRITGLDQLFQIEADSAQAIASFQDG
jgi:anti-anti-sigma factor